MSAEIRINLQVAVSNGSFRDTFNPGLLTMDQASVGGGSPGTVSIGTTEEVVSFGDLSPGLVAIQNLDTTNYIEFGPTSGGAMVVCGKVQPGKIALFELGASVSLRAKANTAACKVLIKGFN